jgi:hypothetical protein
MIKKRRTYQPRVVGDKVMMQKTANKIHAMFGDRRLLSGHMFFNADLSDWHFFYFDQRDFATRNNHWKEGPHIHFINRLWPNRTAQSVWEEFCSSPNPLIRDALHIRFNRNRPLGLSATRHKRDITVDYLRKSKGGGEL